MSDAFLPYDLMIRLGAFAGVFALMAVWELLAPRRHLEFGRGPRWPSNLGIVVIDTLLLRRVFPTAAVGRWAPRPGLGPFPRLRRAGWLAVIVTVILLDLAIYIQHVLFHTVPVLWRLHRMHHADLGFDVSTGLRFHPIEILLSMMIKLTGGRGAWRPCSGCCCSRCCSTPPPCSTTAMDACPGASTACCAGWWSPRHAPRAPRETNSNFGFNLPWWDRLFGTYRAQPAAAHDAMTIGIEQFRAPGQLRLDQMLLQPFRDDTWRYPLGQREGQA